MWKNISLCALCVFCECLTGKAHECTLSSLLPQPFSILIVNIHEVDSLQAKGFGDDHHFLTSIQQLPGILSPCCTFK